MFLRFQSSNTSDNANGVLESSDRGGKHNGRCRHGACDEGDDGEIKDFECEGPSSSWKRDVAVAAEAPFACGAEDEAKVAAFVHLLEANGGETDFLKETR